MRLTFGGNGQRLRAGAASRRLLLAGLLALFAGGCDSDGAGGGDGGTHDIAGGGSDTGGQNAERVEVSLVEFNILMPANLEPGPTTFVVTNDGTMDHNFALEGNGLDESFDANLAPGETRELTVDLGTGDYVAYCPIAGHRGLGMEILLAVSE
jgi:plastocyanin